MRLQLRERSWCLEPPVRAVARDRIRLGLGRHAVRVATVRATFCRAPRGAGVGRLVLTAVLADGRTLSVDAIHGYPEAERFERFVDRQALRLARAVERAGERAEPPPPPVDAIDATGDDPGGRRMGGPDDLGASGRDR
ncbi:MAG TPA: hypothetical protein RMF84_15170 [Polyangiaceae bacterium LLY-WYZ-14_1]|nr:hypothetical protein [Polyangiaceae bacterium LLY-WYZ-14_1]